MLLIAILLISCSGTGRVASRRAALPPANEHWAEQTLKSLTLEEKAAQLVFVWTEGAYFPEESGMWQELERLTTKRKLGGFIFSTGDVYEYAVQINKLQSLADVPLLIAADFEYGAGMRIRRSTTFPRAMAVGATRTVSYAYEMGKAIGKEARAVGVVLENYKNAECGN